VENATRISFLIEAFEKEVDDLASELKLHYMRKVDLTDKDEGHYFRIHLADNRLRMVYP